MCCRWQLGFWHVQVDSIIGTFPMAFRCLLFGNAPLSLSRSLCVCTHSNIKLCKCVGSTFGYCFVCLSLLLFDNITNLPHHHQWGHPFAFLRNPFSLLFAHVKWVAILFYSIFLPLVRLSAHRFNAWWLLKALKALNSFHFKWIS